MIRKRKKNTRHAGTQNHKRGKKARTRVAGTQGGRGRAGSGKSAEQKNTHLSQFTGGKNDLGRDLTTWQSLGSNYNSIDSDPLFNDTDIGDLTIPDNSPCACAGKN